MAVLGLALTVLIHQPRLVQPALARMTRPETTDDPMPMRQLDSDLPAPGLARRWPLKWTGSGRLRAEGIEPVLAGAGWNLPGEISFYCQGQPVVFSLGSGMGDRRSQYDLWWPNPVEDPGPFRGKTFILVGGNDYNVRRAFDRFEETYVVYYKEDEHTIAGWPITVCHGYRGFPPEELQKRPRY